MSDDLWPWAIMWMVIALVAAAGAVGLTYVSMEQTTERIHTCVAAGKDWTVDNVNGTAEHVCRTKK